MFCLQIHAQADCTMNEKFSILNEAKPSDDDASRVKTPVRQFVWLFTLLDIALSPFWLILSSLTRKNLEPTALREAIFNNAFFMRYCQ